MGQPRNKKRLVSSWEIHPQMELFPASHVCLPERTSQDSWVQSI